MFGLKNHQINEMPMLHAGNRSPATQEEKAQKGGITSVKSCLRYV